MKSPILFVAVSSLALMAALTPSRGAESSGFDLKLVAQGFVSPTALASLPGSPGNFLVADQPGTIRVVSGEGAISDQPFLDLRSKLVKLNPGFDERGLLGMALHPKFSENRKFYVAYSAPKRDQAPAEWDHTMRIAEFTGGKEGPVVQIDSEKILLEIDQPYFNHNGGAMAFGPDGYLYIAVGDGGNANDQDERGKPRGRPPEGNGQNLQTLLGKILRIDVDKGTPYSIPQDNPFVGKAGVRAEIYAYGLRNPWRISFDRGGKNELFAADVGQDGFEEVDIIVKGGNYGWNIREGRHCFDAQNSRKKPEDCPKVGANGDPLIDPIMEYKNLKNYPRDPEAKGISITGGYVYRGKALPHWTGKYIFADWSTAWVKPLGVLFAGTKSAEGAWTWQTVKPAKTPTTFYITSLGEDAEGELYLLTNDTNGQTGNSGKVYKIVPE